MIIAPLGTGSAVGNLGGKTRDLIAYLLVVEDGDRAGVVRKEREGQLVPVHIAAVLHSLLISSVLGISAALDKITEPHEIVVVGKGVRHSIGAFVLAH